MPNWVYTSINISGSPELVKLFKEQAGKPHPSSWDENTNSVEYETDPISFWNFIAPPAEAVESGEYFGTNGVVNGEVVGKSANNWYEWNNENWDTKWDACDPSLDEDRPTNLTYRFSTAWSPATPVFEAMVNQFPELNFDMMWEEEQGFGAELTSLGGELVITREWDIPNSHADYEAQDKECWACESGDPDDLYDDCPRENDDNSPEPDMVY